MRIGYKKKWENTVLGISVLLTIINLIIMINLDYVKIGAFGFYQRFTLLQLTSYNILVYLVIVIPIVYLIISVIKLRNERKYDLVFLLLPIVGIILHLLLRLYLGSDWALNGGGQEVLGMQVNVTLNSIILDAFLYSILLYIGMFVGSFFLFIKGKNDAKEPITIEIINE